MKTSAAIAEDIVDLVRRGRANEAIRRYPEHEPEIRTLLRLVSLDKSSEPKDLERELHDLSARESILQQAEPANEANAWHRKALSLSRNGDLARAEQAFDQAIKLAPEFVQAHLNRAILYVRTGRKDKALSDLRAAVRLAPESVRARGMLAQAEADNWDVFKV